jgi:BlaI family transcriptional regulator, penicillinase repressor
MKRLPRISESEWQVMKVLWANSPATANDVIAALAGISQWSDKTVRTLLNRLVAKKALAYKKDGRSYLYRPLVDERQCVRAESRSFLRRVYGGALMPMLAAFLEEDELSAEQIADLRRMLDEKAGGQP